VLNQTRGLGALTWMVFLSLHWSSLVSVWRVRPSNEIKWNYMVNVFFRKERENLSCYYLINHRLSAHPRAIGFLWQKVCGHFFCVMIFWGNFQAPHKQRFGFIMWQFPFPLCYDEIYNDTSTKPCTCSEVKNKLAVTRS